MSSDETRQVEEQAIAYARENKKHIAAERTSLREYPADDTPVSVFMAGSPGAGKTESSKNLIEELTKDNQSVLRIDTDDLRELLPGYTGKNSSFFQGATSIIADRMHDLALIQGQSFVFDGTLAKLTIARKNISRSLKENRLTFIIYVYQDPLQAWEFVKARQKKDGRAVPKSAFIDQYFKARENVNTLKEEFGKKLYVYLIIKNNDGTDFRYYENIDRIDGYVPQRYTYEELERLIVEDL